MGILSLFRKPDTGVYRILNTVTGCVYIGASARSIEERWNHHRNELRRNRHPNSRLQSDWLRYGEDAFRFSVIERVSGHDKVFAREVYWQDKDYDPRIRYNPPNIKTTVKRRPAARADQYIRMPGKQAGSGEWHATAEEIVLWLADIRINDGSIAGRPVNIERIARLTKLPVNEVRAIIEQHYHG